MRALVLIFDNCLGLAVTNEEVAWEYLYVNNYKMKLEMGLGKDNRSREKMETWVGQLFEVGWLKGYKILEGSREWIEGEIEEMILMQEIIK